MQSNKTEKAVRPCTAKSIYISYTTFVLSVLSFAATAIVKRGKFLPITIGICLLAVNIVFAIYCVFKLNSPVYISDKSISQRQFKELVVFKYDEIEDVKISEQTLLKAPPLITLYCGDKQISIEGINTSSRAYEEFEKSCTNEDIMRKIHKITRQKGLL